MPNIILATHGDFAYGLKQSAEMILGKQANLFPIGLSADESLEDFIIRAQELLTTLSGPKIACIDMLGGTPSNTFIVLQEQFPDLTILVGVNLPMVLTILTMQNGLEGLPLLTTAQQEAVSSIQIIESD